METRSKEKSFPPCLCASVANYYLRTIPERFFYGDGGLGIFCRFAFLGSVIVRVQARLGCRPIVGPGQMRSFIGLSVDFC